MRHLWEGAARQKVLVLQFNWLHVLGKTLTLTCPHYSTRGLDENNLSGVLNMSPSRPEQ